MSVLLNKLKFTKKAIKGYDDISRPFFVRNFLMHYPNMAFLSAHKCRDDWNKKHQLSLEK